MGPPGCCRLRCRAPPGGGSCPSRSRSSERCQRSRRVHAKVASVRADSLHKASTGLARRYETVAAEDLYVTGMLASRRLARAVADQGFGAARRMLGYKTAWHGGKLVPADRRYPSSQTCPEGGGGKPSHAVPQRAFRLYGGGLGP